ncbi:MarR family transcriptional regulator [Neobacillus sp. Marseille-QA0830]
MLCLWDMGDGMTQKEIQEHLNIRKDSLSVILNDLAASGWVIRLSDECLSLKREGTRRIYV